MDMGTTNIWLGIMAVVSLLEFVMIVAVGVLGYRMYRQAMETVATVERVHIAPLRARVDGILDEIQLMTTKVKRAQDSVSDALRHVAGTGTMVAGAVKTKSWPIVGIIQGIRTAAASVMRNGKHDHPPANYGT